MYSLDFASETFVGSHFYASQKYQSNDQIYKSAKQERDEHQDQELFNKKTPQVIIESFLALPSRATVQFIGEIEKIKPIIQEIFEKTTGRVLPENIVFEILPKEKFEEKFGKTTLGVSLNRFPFISDVLLKENAVPQLLLTAGHEIGHVLSEPMDNAFLEEAKAYAFMLAWLRTIKENNIAGVGEFVKLSPPAKNGIHDRALNFVLDAVASGKNPLNLFEEIKNGVLPLS